MLSNRLTSKVVVSENVWVRNDGRVWHMHIEEARFAYGIYFTPYVH